MVPKTPALAESGELVIPHTEKAQAADVIRQVNEVAIAVKALPDNPQLGKSIATARQTIDEWTTSMTVDADIALHKYEQLHPERINHAQQKVAQVLARYHAEVRNAIDALSCRTSEVRSSVDVDACKNDLAKHLGINLQEYVIVLPPSETPKAKTYPIEGNGLIFDVDVVPPPEEVSHQEIIPHEPKQEFRNFIDNLLPADIQRLVLDVVSWDDDNKRLELITHFVAEVIERNALKIPDDRKQVLVQGISDFVEQMRNNDLPIPYNRKVSNHVLDGVLPEVPTIREGSVAEDFDQWRNSRRQKEAEVCGDESKTKGVASVPDKNETSIPQHTKAKNRTKVLDGTFIVYNGIGKVEEIMVHGTSEDNERTKENLRELFNKENSAEKPVGIYFVDKNELEDAILYLPTNREAILYLQLKEEDVQCSMYRDENGKLEIKDHLGQDIAPLRNKLVTTKDILNDPFKLFKAQNIRLEFAQ